MDTQSIVTKADCLKVLNKLAAGNFQFVSYRILPYGSEPLGFLGEHWRLHITVDTANKKNVTLQFFMKTVPNDTDAHRNYVIDIGCFKKEALLYKELLSKLQSVCDVPFSPTCYLVSSDSYIILEDISTKGFGVVKDKAKTLDFDHCKCLTETVARFHAASIILEEKNSSENKPYRINDHYKDILIETTFSFEEGNPRCAWVKITVETLVALCKLIEKFKDTNVQNCLDDLIEKIKQFIAPSKKYRNVINHGDLWSNNIMFNYNADMTPKNCVLVDFQMARYTPPAYDFLTFLYLTTTKEFHQENMSTLIDVYYTTFATELKRNKINPEEIMSKKEFIECCEEYKPAALLEAAMFGTIVYLNGDFSKGMLDDPDKFEDFMLKNRSTLVCNLFKEDEVYRKRVESVMTQLMDCIL